MEVNSHQPCRVTGAAVMVLMLQWLQWDDDTCPFSEL